MQDMEKRRKSIAAYRARSTKTLAIRFYPTDMEMLDYIKGQPAVAAYIKGLVAADMASKGVPVPDKFRCDD